MEDFDQALHYHELGLAIRERLKDKQGEGQSWLNIGTALSYLGKVDEARVALEKARDVLEEIQDRVGAGGAYHNLGWLDLDEGNFEAAEQNFQKALTLWKSIEHRIGVAFAYNDLGAEIYTCQKRWGIACEYLEIARNLYEDINANTHLPGNYLALSNVYFAMRRLLEAEEMVQKVQQLVSDNSPLAQRVKDLHQQIIEAAKNALERAKHNKDEQQIRTATGLLEQLTG
jgi:tetratricopeptide (TPR) repeat protein